MSHSNDAVLEHAAADSIAASIGPGGRIGWKSYALAALGCLTLAVLVVGPLVAYFKVRIHFPPMVGDDMASTTMNQPVLAPILLNDADPDGGIDPSTLSVLTLPRHGAVTADPLTGVVRYQPAPEFTGIDSFTYTICDYTGICSNLGVVTINVKP